MKRALFSVEMNKRTNHLIFFLLAAACFMFARGQAMAQQVTDSRDGEKIKRVVSSGSSGPDGMVSFKLEQGGRVAVDNRTTGKIVVIGWDKDTVEATATSERGVEAVKFAVVETTERTIWLKADYLKRPEDEKPSPEDAKPLPENEKPRPEATPTVTAPSSTFELPPLPVDLPKIIRMPIPNYDGVKEPPTRDGKPIEVHIEVRVPRYAELNVIKVIRSRVEVTGIETPIVVLGDRSDVVLKNVREAEVRTRSGGVSIEDTSGFVEVVTASGPVSVRRAENNVRVLTISGNIELECVEGRVNVDSADGAVTLLNVQGDVEANASNSIVRWAGAIRGDGRYHLKTMSGSVEMAVRDKPPGFTAALSSYTGTIENDFQLQLKQSIEQHLEGEINRRIVGRHGDGQAQITLDSFDGKVKLSKLSPAELKECKRKN
jgi:putative adhesin